MTAQPPTRERRARRPHARRPHALIALAAAVALSLTLSACGSEASSQARTTATGPVAGGTLNWAVETKLQTVNPHRNGQDKATPILRNAFDSYLFRTEAGEYQPWLASYKLADEGRKVTLTLGEGITFSDGEPLNAQAVVANFDKVSSDGYLTSIPGGLRFLEGYKAVGEDTVEFTLSQPDSLFLLYLSGTTSSPLSPKSLAKDQTVLESGGPEIAGVGPFVIENYVPNTELTLTKRADYAWAPESIAKGQKAAHLDRVVYRTLSEGSTRTGSLQQGQVQISSDIQPLDVSLFESNPKFTYSREAVTGLPYSLYLNVSKAPFDDIKVRQAFIKGFDLSAILTSIYSGAFEQAKAPISIRSTFANTELLGDYATNVEQANSLLDEAGWTERNGDGVRVKNGKALTVRAISGAPFLRESRDQFNIAVGAALRQNVGIDYQFQVEDLGTEAQRAKANDYEVFDNSYGGGDPGVGLDLLYSSDPARGFIARGKFNDKTIDSLLDKGRFTTDLATRKTAYGDLQKHITEQFYALPVYQTQDNLAATSKVQGITIDQNTGQPFGAFTIWLQS